MPLFGAEQLDGFSSTDSCSLGGDTLSGDSVCVVLISALAACAANSLCSGAKADLYDEEKDWDRVGLPVDVMCKIPGYPLLDFVNDKLSAVNVNGLGASKTSNWRQMMLGKIRDQSKNPGVIDNSTAHSLLCDVYDECIYHFATTEFTYSMRFQSADNFINEDYFEAKSLHCENPFGESARRNGRRRTNISCRRRTRRPCYRRAR